MPEPSPPTKTSPGAATTLQPADAVALPATAADTLPAPPPDLAQRAAADELLDPLIDARFKGWPHAAPPLRRSQVAAQGWQVLAGDLPLPLAVVKRSPLFHNLGWMQRFCASQGVGLAPHGKTSLSPQLFERQLQAGAWGMTLANAGQLPLALAAGAQRVLIANQVLQAQDLAAIAALQAQQPALRVLFLLDSPAQLALIEANAPEQPFEVLIELGLASGGRTGCRTLAQALGLARAARASAAVHLAGIECYEGGLVTGDSEADVPAVAKLMGRVARLALQCQAEGLFSTRVAGDALIFSAGGSAVFDLVAPGLRAPSGWPEDAPPVQGLLRSGCYVTHDQGHYKRLVGVVNQRLGCSDASGLRAALEVWALVQSVPEPGLAILNLGRRDVSFDISLPQPVAQAPRGALAAQPVPADWQVTALNDQHAYLHTGAHSLQVGDRIALGISHPCTTFDKWRWMPIVDADYRVVDALTTGF